jgi:hypothetical protein
MNAIHITDPSDFLDRAGRLIEDDARSGLVLGVAKGIATGPSRSPDAGFFVVDRGAEPVAAALVMPPFNLLLADSMDDQATRALARAVEPHRPSIPGSVLPRFSERGPGCSWHETARNVG